MIDSDVMWYLYPSIVKIQGLYYLYYYDNDFKMYCRISNELYNWDNLINVEIDKFYGDIWHGEVKVIDGKLYLLFLFKDYKLYWCVSDLKHPLKFENCHF